MRRLRFLQFGALATVGVERQLTNAAIADLGAGHEHKTVRTKCHVDQLAVLALDVLVALLVVRKEAGLVVVTLGPNRNDAVQRQHDEHARKTTHFEQSGLDKSQAKNEIDRERK